MIHTPVKDPQFGIAKIPDERRLQFLPAHLPFNLLYMKYEQTVFQLAKEKIPSYNGGVWDFYEIMANGLIAPALVWETDKEEIEILTSNWSTRTNPFTASMAICVIALSNLSFFEKNRDYRDLLVKQYHIIDEWMMNSGDERVDRSAYIDIVD